MPEMVDPVQQLQHFLVRLSARHADQCCLQRNWVDKAVESQLQRRVEPLSSLRSKTLARNTPVEPLRVSESQRSAVDRIDLIRLMKDFQVTFPSPASARGRTFIK